MNIYTDLQNRANTAGVSLRQLAQELGIPEQTVYGWSKKVPRQLERYAQLRDAIERRTHSVVE